MISIDDRGEGPRHAQTRDVVTTTFGDYMCEVSVQISWNTMLPLAMQCLSVGYTLDAQESRHDASKHALLAS